MSLMTNFRTYNYTRPTVISNNGSHLYVEFPILAIGNLLIKGDLFLNSYVAYL